MWKLDPELYTIDHPIDSSGGFIDNLSDVNGQFHIDIEEYRRLPDLMVVARGVILCTAATASLIQTLSLPPQSRWTSGVARLQKTSTRLNDMRLLQAGVILDCMDESLTDCSTNRTSRIPLREHYVFAHTPPFDMFFAFYIGWACNDRFKAVWCGSGLTGLSFLKAHVPPPKE